MGPGVINVDNISKTYRLGNYDSGSLSEELGGLWRRLTGRADPHARVAGAEPGRREGQVFHALSGISFKLMEGEVLGVIGRNGAGKSTLLKLLSRITVPTSGEIRIKGRIASLLEVGTGFHQDLTGRQNIYLNGAILGMRRREIDAKLQEIIAFSGIEHHIDTPVKRYSSGMKVRLGFAVAAHLEPEILVVDEVLAVGDAHFQRKCLGKMRDVSSSGRTILFVSHNLVAIQSLCTRVIWLDQGRMRMDGPTAEVCRAYLNSFSDRPDVIRWDPENAPGTKEVVLDHVHLERNDPAAPLTWRQGFRIVVGVRSLAIEDGDLNVGIHLINGNEVHVLSSTMRDHAGSGAGFTAKGLFQAMCEIPSEFLNAGTYRVVVNIIRKGKFLFREENTIGFEVHDVERSDVTWYGKRVGVVRPSLKWSVLAVPEEPA